MDKKAEPVTAGKFMNIKMPEVVSDVHYVIHYPSGVELSITSHLSTKELLKLVHC